MKRSLILSCMLAVLFVFVAGCTIPSNRPETTPVPTVDPTGYTEMYLSITDANNTTTALHWGMKLKSMPADQLTLHYTIVNHQHRDAQFSLTGTAFMNNSSVSYAPFLPVAISLKDNEAASGTIQFRKGLDLNDTELDIGVMDNTKGITAYMVNQTIVNFKP